MREHELCKKMTGLCYELARRDGLNVVFGPDDPVVYVQFGGAWMRP